MAKGDLSTSQTSGNTRPGGTPLWQTLAATNQSYPMGPQLRQPPMGPFGPMGPRPGFMGNGMGMGMNRGFGMPSQMGFRPMAPQMPINRGFGNGNGLMPSSMLPMIPQLLGNMGMSGSGNMTPPLMSSPGGSNDMATRTPQSY
jgi:hypothetical protein